MIGWNFPPNNDGLAAGANDGAIDAFAGKRLSSVVREVIQNSLDAKKCATEPVKLHFSKQTVFSGEFDGFKGIAPNIEKSMEMAQKQGLSETVKFYEYGLSKITSSREVSILCIHDYNTKGLTGPINEPYGPWFAMTKGAGISQKSSSGSLGSFGHGSKAPFSFSDTRTAFYFTKIETKDGLEERFQGKSILQTHESPMVNGIYTQGTGFYGHMDGNRPLLSDEVPTWARLLREAVTISTGTSIYIPFTSYDTDLYPETKITVISNFFYAIMSNELEVTIGEELIDSSNLASKFYECEKLLEFAQDEIDVKSIEEGFVSAKTILEHDHHNAQEISNFGKVLWWMRLSEDIAWKSVGIARSSGMLITRRPMQLERFRGVKNFDLFVCVLGNKGSDLLKSLENPTHDNFEFDRIKLESTKKDAQRRYKIFTNKIREVVQKYAGIDTTQEEDLDTLSFLFNEVGEEIEDNTEKTERGNRLRILPGPTPNRSKKTTSGSELEYITGIFGRGQTGGSRERQSEGGEIPDEQGITLIKGKPAQTDGLTGGKSFALENLRIAHSKLSLKKAKLFFDSPVSGEFLLSIKAVGEHGSETIKMIAEDKSTSALAVKVEAGTRHKIDVEFNYDSKMFVMEASLNEN